ncbi:MAG: zinc-ribbon domain-containing protein, partial [Gemmatimonadales bacterium]
MNVTCPSCETVYRVDPAKVPAGGVRARCAVCSSVFPVTAAETPLPSAAAQRAPAAAGSAPAGGA